jgi:Mor family transcriptional regulator
VHLGRPRKLTAHQRQEAIARRESGETLVDIARSYNVSHPTIMRLFPSPFDKSSASAAG